ncbi:hypothetical protein CLOSCI_01052 [[Clostridium] scindens ATCC 35704]|nr:hypothetical protein CLOSCI_01052 [[Clostridium] scindens ATCC 35704]
MFPTRHFVKFISGRYALLPFVYLSRRTDKRTDKITCEKRIFV